MHTVQYEVYQRPRLGYELAMSNNDVNESGGWEYYLFSFLSQYIPSITLHITTYTAVMDSNNVKEDIDRLVKGFTSLDS